MLTSEGKNTIAAIFDVIARRIGNVKPSSKNDIRKMRLELASLNRNIESLLSARDRHSDLECFAHGNERFVLKTSMFGLNFLLDPSSLVDRELLLNDQWEKLQIEFLHSVTRFYIDLFQDDLDCVFLDIGAYGGLYSMAAFKSRLFKTICSFEPDRTNKCQLFANLFLNQLQDKVEVYQVAVSDQSGYAEFLDGRDIGNGNRGGAQIGISHGERVYKVRCEPIDALITEKNKFIVIKLDVEGHERQALTGMKSLLANNKVLIQAESWPDQYDAFINLTKDLGLTHFHSIGPDHYLTNYDVLPPSP